MVERLVAVDTDTGELPAIVEQTIRSWIGDDAAPITVKIIAGAGLVGGGQLDADVTLSIDPDEWDRKADLVSGKIPEDQLPALAITEFLGETSDEDAMLALNGQRGDWTVRTDTGSAWIVIDEPTSSASSWREFMYPESPVQSVAGRTGAVTLSATDVSDSGSAGRAVMRAGSKETARAAIDAPAIGTGSSDAMAGDRIRLVSSLPSNPDPDVLYCIPED